MSDYRSALAIKHWQSFLQLKHYSIFCQRISIYQVCNDLGKTGHEFVGIYTNPQHFTAHLYHTRMLNLDDIIHELLHVKYPKWTEEQINKETERLLRQETRKGGDVMKFYNVKTRQSVDVPDEKVTLITMKNGKKAAKAEHNGTKLFKIVGKEDAARLSA